MRIKINEEVVWDGPWYGLLTAYFITQLIIEIIFRLIM